MTSLLGRDGRLLHDLLPRLRVLLHPRLGRLALAFHLRIRVVQMDLILDIDESFSDQAYLIFIAQLVSPDVSDGGIPQGPVPAHRLEQRVQCPDRKDN